MHSIDDSNHHSDEIILNEIKTYLSSNTIKSKANKKHDSIEKISPYSINLVKSLQRNIPEAFSSDNYMKPKIKQTKQISQTYQRKQLPSNPEDLMNYYASISNENNSDDQKIRKRKSLIPKVDLDAKALTLPFGDARMKVQEFIQLDQSLRVNNSSFDNYNKEFNDTSTIAYKSGIRQLPDVDKILTNNNLGSITSFDSIAANTLSSPTDNKFRSRFHRKYPRLLEPFYFTDVELIDVPLRSDIWMLRFIEDCYDEAYELCNTPISNPINWRLRNGFDLGAMDCFPKLVQRVFNVRYSVLEVRTEICKQFLCTLEKFMTISDEIRLGIKSSSTYRMEDTSCIDEEEDIYDGERAQLFSLFLSEEYDVDFLAMFLYFREQIQIIFQFRLRDLNQSRIWLNNTNEVPINVPSREIYRSKSIYYRTQQVYHSSVRKINKNSKKMNTNSTTSSFGIRNSKSANKLSNDSYHNTSLMIELSRSQSEITQGPKVIIDNRKHVVPVTLPTNWHFIRDLSMPEAPLLGFDRALMSLLCVHLLPQREQCNMADRTYLTDQLLAIVRSCLLDSTEELNQKAIKSDIIRDITSTTKSFSSNNKDHMIGKNIKIIPLYVLLKTLCLEWKKLSLETKISMIENDAGSKSLKSLNIIYKDNCEMMRLLNLEISNTEKDQTIANSIILSNEKILRRLERKRISGIINEEELKNIEDVRIILNEQRMKSIEIESNLKNLIKRKKELENRIEILWDKATFGSSASSIKAIKIEKPKNFEWQKSISKLFTKVIKINLAEDIAIKNAASLIQKQKEIAHYDSSIDNISLVSTKSSIFLSENDEQFFLLTVLVKVIVRNVISEGIRRISLQEYLKRREHQLLLLYGSEEYKQMERNRIQKEKDMIEQKRLYMLRVKSARMMSNSIINYTFHQAKSNAEILLFDPWTLLDLDPNTWISRKILNKVEELFLQMKLKYEYKVKKYLFHYFSLNYRINSYMKKMRLKILKINFITIHNHMIQNKMITNSVKRIQHMVKTYLFRKIFNTYISQGHVSMRIAESHQRLVIRLQTIAYIQLWHRKSSIARRYKKTIECLRERRFIITYYTWCDQYRKHRYRRLMMNKEILLASITIQCAFRCYIAYRYVYILKCKRCLALLGKRYLARKLKQKLLRMQRLLADQAEGVLCIREKQLMKTKLSLWKKRSSLSFGVLRLNKAYINDKLRRRFMKWNKYRIYRNRYLNKRIIFVQSAVRMWLVHHKVLKYYKWRRGLLAMQAIYRMKRCRREYEYTIYYYRAAKTIQKMIRGMICRNHIAERRVADIHYASANNNYDRLKYYIEKYPNLVITPDINGNNALHNAAKNAARRTMKLLVKRNIFDPNVVNQEGYTALHLVISSLSVNRDECFFYMLERGFNDEIRGPDGKTTLLIAAEFGRATIVKHLLVEEDYNPNIPDAKGTTCLQTACWQGNAAMVKELIDSEADVNMPGFNGTFPLHDCVHGAAVSKDGAIQIAQMLLSHGAYVNVYDPYNYQTPLMWAAAAGTSDIVRMYLMYGAEVNAKDMNGQTAVHHGVSSNSADIYNALREAEADFEGIDNNHNTPLHLAAETGATEFAIHMLHGGTYPSTQNQNGDQPAHIAARFNQLELLKEICKYDEHIGRLNYKHQTPLGCAKFYLSKECQKFLEHHYRMVDISGGRNKLGEIWWDKEVDAMVGDWEVSVDPNTTERFYINRTTGEVSKQPPTISSELVANNAKNAELPLHRAINIVKEDTKGTALSKHTYLIEYAKKQEELKDFTKDYVNATIIVKFARRKLAYMELKRLKKEEKFKKRLTRWIKRHLPGFMAYRRAIYRKASIKIQAIWRGYRFRYHFYKYPDGDYWPMRHYKAHWRLRYKLWSMWKNYVRRQEFKAMLIVQDLPVTLSDWQVILDTVRKPIRQVGMIEEYLYPNTRNIYFYRHVLTGVCLFQKPKKLKYIDEENELEIKQIKKYGATLKQHDLAKKLQAIVRGFLVRIDTRYMKRAYEISSSVERKYYNDPDSDINLYNYALYCFVQLQDLNRARLIFVESLRRMQWRGPDIPFLLYSYATFALVAHDEDYLDAMVLITRARKAEEEIDTVKRNKIGLPPSQAIQKGTFQYGKVFDLAHIGFFKHTALKLLNSMGWQSLGVCRFLVYNDFNSSFDAFIEAFRYAPDDKNLMSNYKIMMRHFHGPDKSHQDAVIKKRMQHHAQIDADREEVKRVIRFAAQQRSHAAKRIATWYKNQKSRYIFEHFMEVVRSSIRRKKQSALLGSNSNNNNRRR